MSLDPTRTSSLRLRYAKAMNRRFLSLAKEVRESLVTNKALTANQAAREGQFDQATPEEQVEAFESWLDEAIIALILGVVIRRIGRTRISTHWQHTYLDEGYRRGVKRAHTELRAVGVVIEEIVDIATVTRAQIHANTLALINRQAFESLRGITDSMRGQLVEIFSQGILEGASPSVIARRITDQIKAISRRRAQVLARTELVRIYNEAKLNALEQNGIDSVEADVEFTMAGDARVCQKCRGLSGRRYTIQQARGVIPVHASCLPGDAIVTASPGISAVFKRWYDGDMVIINVAFGTKLPCTPNHPVLTPSGFVPAKLIQAGDQVICCFSGNREMIRMHNSDYMPSRIEDIAESFLRSSQMTTMEMPVAAEDFYGDGRDGDVYVVGADVELLHGRLTPFLEHTGERRFQGSHSCLPDESCLSRLTLDIERRFPAFAGSMRSFDLHRSLFSGESLPFKGLSFALGSGFDVGLLEPSSYNASGNTKAFRELVFRQSSQVELLNDLGWQSVFPGPHGVGVGLFEDFKNSTVMDAEPLSNLLRWDLGHVEVQNVASVDVCRFSGHVYDLQTDGGFFVSDSIAVSNCRCMWRPVGLKERIRNAA